MFSFIFFSRINPETQGPIFQRQAKELEPIAKMRGATLRGKWKIEKLLEQ